MDDELVAALTRVQDAFAPYPRRGVLEGCPHCRGSVVVDDHDLSGLTISLGNTVGSRDDVKSLLPVLLERLLVSGELEPSIVFGKLSHQEWRTWPEVEQDAVDGYLDAVWRSVLAGHPCRLESFPDAVSFLDAALLTGESIDRFLHTWDVTLTPSEDRHLAETVNRLNFTAQRPSALGDWLRRDTTRERLYRAFERDPTSAWSDDLARAYDLLRV
ncbi:hypothetical protein ACTWLT_30265 [Micromonospora sp. ZYX-F-536]|uniref:hypothetical protein n=1 Tax=Micromonospora sp. ZYX-F-536 TaxID=3457629 RepID=UPI004040BF67